MLIARTDALEADMVLSDAEALSGSTEERQFN